MSEAGQDAAKENINLEAGPVGQFLHEHDVPSKRLPDSLGVETIEVEPRYLETTIKRLMKSPELNLDFLVTVSGVDSDTTFDSVYHLWSYQNNKELVVKVKTPKSEVAEGQLPNIPSIANIVHAANWHERETYDLVGIRYVGHPYLRRILNPWDWEGHPLRKDYKQPLDALNDKNPDSFR